ncbi:hypothetical protein BDV93DRAFT_414169, partial [Ceratobasidium sp. AG-I]
HTGAYMAEKTSECLARYGLEEKLLSVVLDNASSNDTLVNQLSQRVPHFRGSKSRVRC